MILIMTFTSLFANDCNFQFANRGENVVYKCKNISTSYSYDSKSDQIKTNDEFMKKSFSAWREGSKNIHKNLKSQKDTFQCR